MSIFADRKCINCTSFPCMKEECAKDNVCSKHKFRSEQIIEENYNHIPMLD